MFKSIFLIVAIFFLTGCKQYNYHINKNYKTKSSIFSPSNSFDNINKAVKEIADQLLINIPAKTQKYNKFVITTFVNLNKFSQTSNFGRIFSESLIDQLHTRNFHIVDFRTQDVIVVNRAGEFSLTRDVEKLRDEMPDALIVVGTYSVLNNHQAIINVRIVNSTTSDVISTAKVVYNYQDCKQFNFCKIIPKKKKPIIKFIPITKDDN